MQSSATGFQVVDISWRAACRSLFEMSFGVVFTVVASFKEVTGLTKEKYFNSFLFSEFCS